MPGYLEKLNINRVILILNIKKLDEEINTNSTIVDYY